MKTIAIDFDGVIHAYSKGWQDGSIYDEPIAGVREFIDEQFELGNSVVIHSTREPEQIIEWMKSKFQMMSFMKVPDDVKFWNVDNWIVGVTNRKLPAHIYIDDRGYKFEGTFPDTSTFKTWLE